MDTEMYAGTFDLPTQDLPSPIVAYPTAQVASVLLSGAILVTLFKNQYAKTKEEKRLSLKALAEIIETARAQTKGALPWLKCARFGDLRSDKGSLRHDANVIAVTGCEGDYDGERMPFEEACEILRRAHILALIYTSPSHSEGGPRWRVICPFSKECQPDQRDQMMARLNGVLAGIFGGESFTLSQSYYYGAVGDNPPARVAIIDGDFIDLRDDLDSGAIGKEPGQAADSCHKTTGTVIGLRGSPPGVMVQRRAAQSGAAGAPSMNDAAQTDVHWADKLSPENLNAMLWALATDPRVVALANQPRDKWRQFVWSFKAFEQLGATEAKEAARKWSQDGASEEHPFTEEGFENVWGSFDPAGGTTAGTLLGAANKVRFDLNLWRDLANGAAGQATTVVGSSAGTTAGGKPLKIDPSGPRAITDIPAFLQPHDAVAIMNATFAFAHSWGGEALLVQFHPDGSLTAISEEQLKKSFANRRVEITSDDGTKKSYINLAKYLVDKLTTP